MTLNRTIPKVMSLHSFSLQGVLDLSVVTGRGMHYLRLICYSLLLTTVLSIRSTVDFLHLITHVLHLNASWLE